MSELPDEIWVWREGDTDQRDGGWTEHSDSLMGPEVKFIRVDLASPLAAGAMRQAAGDVADRHRSRLEINEPLWHEGQDWAADRIARAIHDLPSPTRADLLAAALQLPEVRAMVEWLRAATRDIETGETMYDDARPDMYVGEILERLAALEAKP